MIVEKQNSLLEQRLATRTLLHQEETCDEEQPIVRDEAAQR